MVGDIVTFTVNIKNQGGGQASPSYVDYYIDDTKLSSASIGQIGAGSSTTRTFTWTAQLGSHTFKAIADANHNVNEDDETNNTLHQTICIEDGPVDDGPPRVFLPIISRLGD